MTTNTVPHASRKPSWTAPPSPPTRESLLAVQQTDRTALADQTGNYLRRRVVGVIYEYQLPTARRTVEGRGETPLQKLDIGRLVPRRDYHRQSTQFLWA